MRPHHHHTNHVVHILPRQRSNPKEETLTDVQLNNYEPEDIIWASIKQNIQQNFKEIPIKSKPIQESETYGWYDKKHPIYQKSKEAWIKAGNYQENKDSWTDQKLPGRQKTESLSKTKVPTYGDDEDAMWFKPIHFKAKEGKKRKQKKKSSHKPRKRKKKVSLDK